MLKRLFMCFIPFLFLTNIAFADEFDYSRDDFQAIVKMLDMEGHGNDDLATCTIKQLYYKEVASMMDKGMTNEEILKYYVDQQGESALKAPLKKGFSLVAWVTPFVLLLLATILVYYIIHRFIKSKKSQPKTTVNDSKVDDIENEILLEVIEEERKKYF